MHIKWLSCRQHATQAIYEACRHPIIHLLDGGQYLSCSWEGWTVPSCMFNGAISAP
jgi:hypothetical protein